MKYLKDEIYYRDRYDRITVEECRAHVSRRIAELEREAPEDSREMRLWKECLCKTELYFMRGEYYASKDDTVRMWMALDRQKDERLERSDPPLGIRCLACRCPMTCEEKELHGANDDRVLFFFACPRCRANRAFFENREEYRPKQISCQRCKTAMTTEYHRSEGQVTMITTCARCGTSETKVFDFGKKPEVVDADYITDRENYCLNEKDGNEYLSGQESNERWEQYRKEETEREKLRPILDEISKLRNLTIVEAQNLMARSLERIGYTRIEFGSPTIKTDIQVGFSAQDAKAGRDERESLRALRHQFSQMLGDTNWQLMSGGVTYRLGLLTGEMRGVESEQELIKMVRIRLKNRNIQV
jgi:hypothetical protein